MPAEQQMAMLEIVLYLYDEARKLVARNIPISQLMATGIFGELYRMKFAWVKARPRRISSTCGQAIAHVLAQNE